MSFVAFTANAAGTPPSPFLAFLAGVEAFYLVGVATVDGAPAPSGQLSVTKAKVSGDGRNPVDSMTETAKGWRGRRRVTVATRTFSYARYTRGARREAQGAAQWTAPNGDPLVMWSHVVTVDNARALGYRVPRGRTTARGRRNVGVENNARGTVRGRSVVQASPSLPTWEEMGLGTAPVAPAPVAPAVPTSLPAWARSMAATADSIESRRVAREAREQALVAREARRVADLTAAQNAVESIHPDPSVARFRLLDLSDGPNARTEAPVEGPGRVPMID